MGTRRYAEARWLQAISINVDTSYADAHENYGAYRQAMTAPQDTVTTAS